MSELPKITDQQALQGAYNELMVCERIRQACLLAGLVGISKDGFVKMCSVIYEGTIDTLQKTKEEVMRAYLEAEDTKNEN
jgi:hypothetical protein